MKKIYRLCCVLLLGALLPVHAFAGLMDGGGSDQIAPDSMKAGEPAVIKLVVSTWGSNSPIHGRFTNLLLHYRRAGEDRYQTVKPEPAALPDNYKAANKDLLRFEAHAFTVPAYPTGASGEIEYYFDMTFDGYPQHAKGMKKITLVP